MDHGNWIGVLTNQRTKRPYSPTIHEKARVL